MLKLKIPNVFMLFIISSIVATSLNDLKKTNKSNNQSVYTPFNISFLEYLKNLKDKNKFIAETASNNSNQFEFECATYQHGFSYYFQLAYKFLCNDRATDFCCDNAEKLCWLTEKLAAQSANYFVKRGPKNISVYNEVIQEDVSFCTPIVCPLVNDRDIKGNFSLPLSLYDCMPGWCRVGFFIIVALDILLTISIAVPNVFVLAIAVKHSFHQTPGG